MPWFIPLATLSSQDSPHHSASTLSGGETSGSSQGSIPRQTNTDMHIRFHKKVDKTQRGQPNQLPTCRLSAVACR